MAYNVYTLTASKSNNTNMRGTCAGMNTLIAVDRAQSPAEELRHSPLPDYKIDYKQIKYFLHNL